ncbi:MAG: hypothetical protein HY877_08995 [Deltaproteobacteria bacterium]|nr:hypothetical protein [Deltaproteobacteria bacterium]
MPYFSTRGGEKRATKKKKQKNNPLRKTISKLFNLFLIQRSFSTSPLIRRLAVMDIVPIIFEQPVRRDDIEGLRRVREEANKYGTMVFADESVYSLRDAQTVLDAKSVGGINLKLMKHGGLLEAMRIADFAHEHGLKLMIGGMVESRLGMSASLHFALAIGGDVVWFDLDTPMLIEGDPLSGGLQYTGPSMTLPQSPGIGVQTR